MPIVNISPVWNGTQFLTETGKPLVGGKIYTYEAGSMESLKTTYSNNTGTAENPNPIVLDASGRMPTDIWLVPGEFYNLVLNTPTEQFVKNVDFVNVGQIIAGDNISIDPPNGIGAVTVTGLWPKYIVSTFGHGRSYLYWLTGNTETNMMFDGNDYSNFTATLKSPTTVETHPDVTWNATAKQFVFNNAGSYTFVITGKIDPRVGESLYWPRYATVFGANIVGSGNNTKTYHTRYSNSMGDGLSTDNQITTWTDEIAVSVPATGNITLSLYALSPNYSSNEALTDVSVIITRFGDPYVIPD